MQGVMCTLLHGYEFMHAYGFDTPNRICLGKAAGALCINSNRPENTLVDTAAVETGMR